MTSYFIRRIMLVPVTFVIITFMVFYIQRVAPGGPLEQAEMQLKGAMSGEGGAGMALVTQDGALPKEALEPLRQYYRLDKPPAVAYLYWLGGIVTGDFGKSYIQGEPVLKVITGKFYISVYFGLIGYITSWLVCVPLGVFKALKHKSAFDVGSSILVFAGYSIPGFIACLMLLVLFGGGSYWDLVPLGGFRSDKWDELNLIQKVLNQIHHTIVPCIGYMIGSFATMTILMKNSLLENMGADYVRTAFAKGLSERRVIFMHAMRNSLIPITAGIGHALGILFAGSFFIEKVCNIPGMGYLGYTSLLARDFPIILGVLVFGVLIRLTGNIFSDMVWAAIDPRIRFT